MLGISCKRFGLCFPLVAVSAVLIFVMAARAAEKDAGDAAVQAAIRDTANDFRKAFDRADAKAIAALWTENGSLADEQGRFFKGRKAIEDEYTAFFKAHPGTKIQIAVQSVELPSPDTAVEDGLARIVTEDGTPPVASRYTAVHVLVDGKWLMGTVRESGIELPSNYGRLQNFEWLVGKWETNVEETAVHTTVRWLPGRSFLEREYRVLKSGVQESSGLQIIGWDPKAGKVRSWSFDSQVDPLPHKQKPVFAAVA
jgi:uncharacterized protein (TIGR02246 family)